MHPGATPELHGEAMRSLAKQVPGAKPHDGTARSRALRFQRQRLALQDATQQHLPSARARGQLPRFSEVVGGENHQDSMAQHS